ncbi:MAG: PEGA domain-containing protein [Bacteroidota bacterium]
MTPPEHSVSPKRRIPAGSFEPMGGPNYAPPSAMQAQPPPLPFSARIPPPLLFGFLLAVLLGAGGFLFFSSSAEPEEELTAETIGALIHEQEQTVRESAAAITESRTGSAVLEIETYPAGARVMIDGQRAGETPVRRDRLASQWYVLSIWKNGHLPVDSLVYLEPGQRTRLAVTLTPDGLTDLDLAEPGLAGAPLPEPVAPAAQPPRTSPPARQSQAGAPTTAPVPARTGSLSVTSRPSGASVTLGGRSVGTTPVSLSGLAPGSHTVGLALADYETQSIQVDVAAGQRNTVQAAMTPVEVVPQTGSLSVIVHPWGSIYINGTLHARDTDLRYEVALPVGTHRVRVEHPALGAWERTVEVTPDQPASLTANLSPR